MPPGGGTLIRDKAAAYIGFAIQTFNIWIRRGLLPAADPSTCAWSREALYEAIEGIKRNGIQNDNPSRRHSDFIKIYHCKHYWRGRTSGGGRLHFYFTPTWETLPSPWGGPAFMAALIDCERRYATQLLDSKPSGPTRTQAPNQSPTELVSRIRRRAIINQAEIARIIRAAKQAGAAEVRLRLTDSAVAIVCLQPDNSVASDDQEIIL
jgi:hypothetical protein